MMQSRDRLTHWWQSEWLYYLLVNLACHFDYFCILRWIIGHKNCSPLLSLSFLVGTIAIVLPSLLPFLASFPSWMVFCCWLFEMMSLHPRVLEFCIFEGSSFYVTHRSFWPMLVLNDGPSIMSVHSHTFDVGFVSNHSCTFAFWLPMPFSHFMRFSF